MCNEVESNRNGFDRQKRKEKKAAFNLKYEKKRSVKRQAARTGEEKPQAS